MSTLQTEYNVTKTQGPSEEQWDAHRPLITHYYRDQKKKLEDVRRRLLIDHGFCASINMYKKRITKWGVDKKRKRSEMVFAARILKHREQRHKATRLLIRDEEVTQADMDKYFKRAPLSSGEYESEVDMKDAPADLRVLTPSPKLAQGAATVPDSALSSRAQPTGSNYPPGHDERVNPTVAITSLSARRDSRISSHPASSSHDRARRFSSFMSGFEGDPTLDDTLSILDTTQIALVALDKLLGSTSINTIELRGWESSDARYHAIVAANNARLGWPAKALRSTDMLFDSLEGVVHKADAFSVTELLTIYDTVAHIGVKELPMMFLKHIRDLAAILHGPSHEFVALFQAFARGSKHDIVSQGYSDLADFYTCELGLEHEFTLDILGRIAPLWSSDKRRTMLQKLYAYEDTAWSSPKQTWLYYRVIAYCGYDRGNVSKALQAAKKLGSLFDQLRDKDSATQANPCVSMLKAAALFGKGHFEDALGAFDETWDVAVANFLEDRYMTTVLEDTFRMFGLFYPAMNTGRVTDVPC